MDKNESRLPTRKHQITQLHLFFPLSSLRCRTYILRLFSNEKVDISVLEKSINTITFVVTCHRRALRDEAILLFLLVTRDSTHPRCSIGKIFDVCASRRRSSAIQKVVDTEKILQNGDDPIGEVPYEYPIVLDSELTPSSNNLTTQIRGQVYFPNRTSSSSSPILIFLPGKHPDCRLPVPDGYPALDTEATDSQGRCPFNLPTVPSHLGFGYLGRYFASHGYIVISIDILLINNKWGIPGDFTLNFVRARIVLRTIEKMIEWNRSSEVSKRILSGVDLSNRFDFTQIGVMGHSRGGEGVRNAYNMLMEGKGPSDAPQWRQKLPGVMIRAVMEVAPMYYGENGTRLGVENIPWAMLVSGCEDDEVDYSKLNCTMTT